MKRKARAGVGVREAMAAEWRSRAEGHEDRLTDWALSEVAKWESDAPVEVYSWELPEFCAVPGPQHGGTTRVRVEPDGGIVCIEDGPNFHVTNERDAQRFKDVGTSQPANPATNRPPRKAHPGHLR